MNNSIKVKKSIKAAKKAFKKGFDLWYYTGDYNEKNERLMSCISEQQERFNEEFINDKQYYIF